MKFESRFVWILVLAGALAAGPAVFAANNSKGEVVPASSEGEAASMKESGRDARAPGESELTRGESQHQELIPGQSEGTPTELILDSKTEIEKCDFGIVTDRTGPTKEWTLHPVVVIPNLPGIQYAWRIRTKGRTPVFVREEFTLPEPPSSWKINQKESPSQLLNGGQQCVLESFQLTDDGWLGHSWTASHGDPPGSYQIKIWINGDLAHTFVFNVGEPIDDPNIPKRDI